MKGYDKTILVTGGCGFIGSALCDYLVQHYPNYCIINFDYLTYAGNRENVDHLEEYDNYRFYHGDINDTAWVSSIIETAEVDIIMHLAAESHVDNSLTSPSTFVRTNTLGTFNLLNVAYNIWKETGFKNKLFYYISTDEVFGSLKLGDKMKFNEDNKIIPSSPYSASKAAGELFVNAYYHTYGMPVIISNCSNNYGPRQHNEKLIPKVIDCLVNNKLIPIYGNGINVRDWVHVDDNVRAMDLIIHKGKIGERYCIGGNCPITNIHLINTIIEQYNKITGDNKFLDDCIEFVADRLGHDEKYSVNFDKIKRELGWEPIYNLDSFHIGIYNTIQWYLENRYEDTNYQA